MVMDMGRCHRAIDIRRLSSITSLLSAVLLFIAACGSGSGAGEAPAGNSQGDHASSAGSETEFNLPLSQGKHPPGLVVSYPAAIWRCQVTVSSPDKSAHPIEVERLHSVNVCFALLAGSTSPVQIELIDSSGKPYREQGLDRGDGEWTFIAEGDFKPGSYRYRAALDLDSSPVAQQAVGEITVVTAHEPSILRRSQTAPSGARGLQFDLAGYPPNSRVQVFLYAFDSSGLPKFSRPLPQGIIGPNGEGTYSWEANTKDPKMLTIWLNPTPPDCSNEPCIWV
jgi:hypothetical protein